MIIDIVERISRIRIRTEAVLLFSDDPSHLYKRSTTVSVNPWQPMRIYFARRNTTSYVLRLSTDPLSLILNALIFPRQDPYSSINRNSNLSTVGNDYYVHRSESASRFEQDDLYRLQRLYHRDEQAKYKNGLNNEYLSQAPNTAKPCLAPLVKSLSHETK